MNAFDIIGPIMIGPSSSHTAGACRIGNYVRSIVNEDIFDATIKLSGSFKETFKGHGTDRAVVAGLMGFLPDDKRLPESLEIAKKEGRKFEIIPEDIELAHPNTAYITVRKKGGSVVEVEGASIGGGNIVIKKINGINVAINGKYDVIIVDHQDIPGMIHKITKVLYENKININGLSLSRTDVHSNAVVVVEVDDDVDSKVVDELKEIQDVHQVILLKALKSV